MTPEKIDSLLAVDNEIIDPPRNMVVLNPAGLAADYVALSYYHAFSPSHALGVFGGFTYRPLATVTVTGPLAGVAYRYYPGKRALWRFHYGPMLSYNQFHLKLADSTPAASGVGLGAMVGWQWLPDTNFTAGFALGGQWVFGGGDVRDPALARMFKLRPLLAFDIGYAW